MIDELPGAEEIIEILKSMEAPYYPDQINVSEQVFFQRYLLCKRSAEPVRAASDFV